MSKYKLVPMEKLKEWEATINTIALQTAFDIADDIAQYSYAPAVQVEPVGWYTEDHLDDKSATTYNAEVAQRWCAKGWPVTPLYTAPQPAEQPDVTQLVEALEELIDLMEDIRQGEYVPDSFTTQPARIALVAHRKQGGE